MSGRICYHCQRRILHKEDAQEVDGNCWRCYAGYWQDESITIGCKGVGEQGGHGCRGWGPKCSAFRGIPEEVLKR
jgi:hypothetical protein